MVVLHIFRDSERDTCGGWVKNGKVSVTQLLNSPLHTTKDISNEVTPDKRNKNIINKENKRAMGLTLNVHWN